MTPERAASIWEIAGITPLRARVVARFDNQFVKDLLEMRRQGVFAGLWIDADKIKVCAPGQDVQRLTRAQADLLIEAWKIKSKITRVA